MLTCLLASIAPFSHYGRPSTEILQRIFILSTYLTDHRTRTISHYFPYTPLSVNHRWNDLILATPEAWQTVYICQHEKSDLGRTTIGIAQQISRAGFNGSKMHFDIYYKSSRECEGHPKIHCIECCLRCALGHPNVWKSGRIMSGLLDFSYLYIHHHILKCTLSGSQLPALTDLAIVPYDPSGEIKMPFDYPWRFCFDVTGASPLEKLYLQAPLTWLSRAYSTQTMRSLRSLYLERISPDQLVAGFQSTYFPLLEELVIMCQSPKRTVPSDAAFHFGSVKRAALHMVHNVIAERILASLTGVEELVIDFNDIPNWQTAFRSVSMLPELSMLAIFHPIPFDDLHLLVDACQTPPFQVHLRPPPITGTNKGYPEGMVPTLLPSNLNFSMDVLDQFKNVYNKQILD